MNDVHMALRDAGEALVSVLDEITAVLEHGKDDVAWLKPLLVLHAEIDFTARRARTFDPVALADECGELRELLTRAPRAGEAFGARYVSRRDVDARVHALHERALGLCSALGSH
jgi:hypothetical protein